MTAILYITNSLRISFVMSRKASFFLVLLNCSLNPLVYCWRYREIRETVKSTVKKYFAKTRGGGGWDITLTKDAILICFLQTGDKHPLTATELNSVFNRIVK